jgi:hypothetical protein
MKFFQGAVCAITIALSAWAHGDIAVRVDGKPIQFDGPGARVIGGRTMVPLRGVFEAIGAYVEYDRNLRTVRARKNNEEVMLRVGERVATKNGAEMLLDVPAMIVSQRTMVPLRFVAESLGAKVEYDPDNNLVKILTGIDPTLP